MMGRNLKTRACDRILLLFIRFGDLEGKKSVRLIGDVHIDNLSTARLVIPHYRF